MSELRHDPVYDRSVIIAPERGRRPHENTPCSNRPLAKALPLDPSCPFCPGNESQLSSIIAETPSANKPGWRTRVVPNKFPVVRQNAGHDKHESTFYKTALGRGRHEVVIESPRHDCDLTTMSEKRVGDILATYRSRYAALMAEGSVCSVTIFRNRGARGGASLPHPHSQLIALDLVPPATLTRGAAMRSYYQKEKRCVLCDVIGHERDDGSRIVNENGAFLTVVPFAANVPFEMWIMPKRHHADFADLTYGEIRCLANALRDALVRLSAALNDPPYNYVVDSAPNGESGAPELHWLLRIRPQVTLLAGFELGSGLSINQSLPEEDAAILRSVRPV